MNAISQSLIAKIFSGQYNPENPLTWAALILAGIISGDLSDPDVQLAISRVNRIALSSENPGVWIAALLADIAVNGLPGSFPMDGALNEVFTWGANGPEWGVGTPGPAGVSGMEHLKLVTDYTGGGASKLDGLVTVAVTVPQLYYFTHTDGSGRVYELVAGTDAEASPGVIRPDDYNAGTNAKVFVSRI